MEIQRIEAYAAVMDRYDGRQVCKVIRTGSGGATDEYFLLFLQERVVRHRIDGRVIACVYDPAGPELAPQYIQPVVSKVKVRVRIISRFR